jgi:hypothetical protein
VLGCPFVGSCDCGQGAWRGQPGSRAEIGPVAGGARPAPFGGSPGPAARRRARAQLRVGARLNPGRRTRVLSALTPPAMGPIPVPAGLLSGLKAECGRRRHRPTGIGRQSSSDGTRHSANAEDSHGKHAPVSLRFGGNSKLGDSVQNRGEFKLPTPY